MLHIHIITVKHGFSCMTYMINFTRLYKIVFSLAMKSEAKP